MKVAVKKIDALKRELKFEVPKERVATKLEEVFQEVSKVAKVKGFRPGKAPRHVLEAEHGAFAKEETVNKLIPEVYQEGIQKESLAPIDLPEIHDVNLKDGILTFTAHIDIKPEVKISNYKEIPVKRKSAKVTDEEINKTLEYFKKSQGDDKEIAIDDTLARGLGYPDLEAFKQSLSRQIEIDKDRQNRVDVENQIVDVLIKNAKLTIPQSLVKKQIEYRMSEAHKRLQSQGVEEAEMKKRLESLKKDLQKPVEKDVEVYLILDKIGELEGIKVKEGENLPVKVMEFLMKEAKWENES